jgi:penicillin-binding protein 1C
MANPDCRRRQRTLPLERPDRYQLVVMDESGQVATANFTLQ